MIVLSAITSYVKKFFDLAKSKVTTYVALTTAALNELLANWDTTASLLPPWLLKQKVHIVSLAALLAIWSRIRRLLKDPPAE